MLYDKDIREPLFDFLEEKYGKVRIIEEKQMGKSRADVVMVTDESITGIEIKSDADTYARLDRQVTDYNKHFDYNYIVVGSSHGLHVEEHVPDWWGIITVDEVDADAKAVDFYILREASVNPKQHWEFFRKRQLSFLWRMELAHIQELHGFHKYNYKSKKFIQDYLFENVEEQELKKDIINELFERDYNTVAEKINEYREAHGAKIKKTKKKAKTRRKTSKKI